MPITYIYHKNEQKPLTKKEIEEDKILMEKINRKNLFGSVELSENIETEYKELDKREIGILNTNINCFINENLRFYSIHGNLDQINTSFNKMYNVLFNNKKLEDIKDETFNRRSNILAKMLLETVNCNENRYKRYNIDISSSNSEDKKQEIKEACEKLFLNILTRKYNILREQDKLDFKLPSKEEENSSDLESSNKQEIESDKNIISKNNKVVMEEQEQVNINTTENKNSINISIDSGKNEASSIHTTLSAENSENTNKTRKTMQMLEEMESDIDNGIPTSYTAVELTTE